MEKVGFGIFGRPVDYKFISNGIFNILKENVDAYLDLPNNTSLQKGDMIAKISRQEIKIDSKSYEIIKIYLFSYAESFNSRPGGFIGSAYAFIGNPTQKLLYNSIKYLHTKALNELDATGKFKSKELGASLGDLIKPNLPGLVEGKPLKYRTQPGDGSHFILLDGPILEYLMSAVQGFMYNPNFRNLNSIYVSNNKELIRRCAGGNAKKVWTLGHLLNFDSLFRTYNSRLSELQERIKTDNANFEEFKKEKTSLLEKLESKISDQNKELREGNSKIQNLDLDIIGKTDRGKNLTKKLEELKREKEKEEENNRKLKKANFKMIKTFLLSSNYSRERKHFINESDEVKTLEKEVKKLNEKVEKFQPKVPLKKKLMFFGAVLLGAFLIGGISGLFITKKSKKVQQKLNLTQMVDSIPGEDGTVADMGVDKREDNDDEKESVSNLTLSSIKLTELNEYIDDEDKLNEHKAQLDVLIASLTNEINSGSIENKDDFLKRDWYFIELIDLDERNLEKGFDRYEKVKALYRELGEENEIELMNKLMIPGLTGYKDTIHDFETSKRNEILKKYLDFDGNIYSDLKLDVDDIVDFEKDRPLLFLHFRWVISELNKKELNEKDRDLLESEKTEFMIPIKE